MSNCNLVTSPSEVGLNLTKDVGGKRIDGTFLKQIVKSLMYLTTTRPDITHNIGIVDFGLFYRNGEKTEFIGFYDSDYAGDLDDRKNTSGYAFMLSSGAVSWPSKKQPIVTLSTTEAELLAATTCVSQDIWLRNILIELNFKQQ
ncbi:hypothetical protein KY289_013555 [Solanum tuberosum]|nr:hypothetical protein KY289_013555 [Solanum tuberosum]